MAKLVSLLVKVGALVCIIFLPTKLIINFQLLSNIWIVQILPAVFLGLYTNWFHRSALITGLIGGLAVGTGLVIAQGFESSVYAFHLGGVIIPLYAAIPALAANLLICVALTPVLNAFGLAKGEDQTAPSDFEAHPVPGLLPRFQAQQAQQQMLQEIRQPVETFIHGNR
jgi:SSS family solute:Na+ symporter